MKILYNVYKINIEKVCAYRGWVGARCKCREGDLGAVLAQKWIEDSDRVSPKPMPLFWALELNLAFLISVPSK